MANVYKSSTGVKHSTIRNNRSPTFCSLYRQDIGDIDNGTRYPRWKSSILKPKLVPFEKAATQQEFLSDPSFADEQTLYRRPRLVRGWYLGKEPLVYRQQSTPFRFSFNTKNNKKATREGGNERKPIRKRATLAYPESMNVAVCNLQTRPIKQEKKQLLTGTGNMPSAASKGKSTKVHSDRRLNKNEASKSSILTFEKGTSAHHDKDWKDSDQISGLTRKVHRQNDGPYTAKFREKKQIKGKNLRTPVIEFLSERYESVLRCESENGQDKVVEVYTKKFPDCCMECLTFKESDYDIWSRTSYY